VIGAPTVAASLNNLAGLLQATNRLSEAEPLYRRALAILEKSYGPDHPVVATNLNNLALLLRATNRLSEAESLYRRALAILEKSRPRPSCCRDEPQQPRRIAAGHQAAERGGAAVQARAGDLRGELRPGPSRHRDKPQQPRRITAGSGLHVGEALSDRVIGVGGDGAVADQ